MKTLMLAEFDRYKLAIAIVLASVVTVAAGITLMDVKGSPYSFSVLGFCYLLALVIAFAGGRIYDTESADLRFLAQWPQSRLRLFTGRLVSHLIITGLTIVALYAVAVACMLARGRPFADFLAEHVLSPTVAGSISLFALVFAFAAFWSQFTGSALSLLMTLISVLGVRTWTMVLVQGFIGWRLGAQYVSMAEYYDRLYGIPNWITLGLAACVLIAAGVSFVRVPLLEVRRRAFWSTGIVMAVLAVLGLLHSLDGTNWLGFSEARYEAVHMGMGKMQVSGILGRPRQVYRRSEIGVRIADHVSYVRGDPPNGGEEAKRRAEEVWEWWHPIDQTIGVVFDGSGLVIYKWVDY